jgi:pyridoxine/pyridoxamine 5'-phosphate oxidase
LKENKLSFKIFYTTLDKRFIMLRFFILLVFPLSLLIGREADHPIKRVKQWIEGEKQKSDAPLHRFATLSTIGEGDLPYSYTIEMIGLSQTNGILFFSHKQSSQSQQIALRPIGALNIWLPKTGKEICLNGKITEMAKAASEKKWKQLSRRAKLSFLVSKHVGPLESYPSLAERQKELELSYQGNEIPMPETFILYQFYPEQLIFYETCPRSFPKKELRKWEKGAWTSSLLEP